MQETIAPRHKQEPQYQYVLVGLHNIFMFYQEDEEAEGIDEIEQPMQDSPPSPLNEPQDFEEQAGEEQQGLTRQTLKERLQERFANELDPNIKANLQWELHVVELAEQRFPKVEKIYEAHRQTKLPLTRMKIELNCNMAKLMPLCKMEDLGGPL